MARRNGYTDDTFCVRPEPQCMILQSLTENLFCYCNAHYEGALSPLRGWLRNRYFPLAWISTEANHPNVER
jgi:hypothetical protein